MRPWKQISAAVALGSFLLACADGTGPVPTGDRAVLAPAGAMSALKGRSRTTTLDLSTTIPATAPTPLRFAAWAPPLETYDTSFTVVQGRASSDTLYFQRDANGLRMPYLVITVPSNAQFVDPSGNPVPRGGSVNLTVQADSQFVQVNFGPHGSTFSKNPAVVEVSWFYTDLMGRPASDLRLWYQPDVNTAWSPLATQVDLQFYWAVSKLEHFSNYAVAY